MTVRSLGVLGIMWTLGLSVTGCAGELAEPGVQTAPSTEAPSPPPSPVKPPFRDPGNVIDQSIFLIKNPESRVAVGARVVVSGLSLKVTASAPDRVWIQEAADEGRCDGRLDVVGWRAITVFPSTDLTAPIRPGQRVEVTGIVGEREGRRVLEGAIITVLDEPVRPLEPHCERDAEVLAQDALDAVLVTTAGSTESFGPPSNGAWSLAPCFGGLIGVGTNLTEHEDWSPSWHSVTGVLVRDGGTLRIEPRSADDITGNMHDDVCL